MDAPTLTSLPGELQELIFQFTRPRPYARIALEDLVDVWREGDEEDEVRNAVSPSFALICRATYPAALRAIYERVYLRKHSRFLAHLERKPELTALIRCISGVPLQQAGAIIAMLPRLEACHILRGKRVASQVTPIEPVSVRVLAFGGCDLPIQAADIIESSLALEELSLCTTAVQESSDGPFYEPLNCDSLPHLRRLHVYTQADAASIFEATTLPNLREFHAAVGSVDDAEDDSGTTCTGMQSWARLIRLVAPTLEVAAWPCICGSHVEALAACTSLRHLAFYDIPYMGLRGGRRHRRATLRSLPPSLRSLVYLPDTLFFDHDLSDLSLWLASDACHLTNLDFDAFDLEPDLETQPKRDPVPAFSALAAAKRIRLSVRAQNALRLISKLHEPGTGRACEQSLQCYG
jgi:hypothetical protein